MPGEPAGSGDEQDYGEDSGDGQGLGEFAPEAGPGFGFGFRVWFGCGYGLAAQGLWQLFWCVGEAGEELGTLVGFRLGWCFWFWFEDDYRFRIGWEFGDLRSEFVAEAGDSEDEFFAGVEAAQGFLQEEDVLIEVALFAGGFGAKGAYQLFLGDNALCVHDEDCEEIEGARTEREGVACAQESAAREVDFEVGEPVFALLL